MLAESTSRSEIRTTTYCVHPYFGFVCRPNSRIDFSEVMSVKLNRPAIAHIDAWGFRNQNVPVQKPENEIWIGLFGGSVAFSVASSSDETTIAKYLEVALTARAQVRKKIRVLNFALPGGQQPQQFVIYSMKTAILDGVITFDGINEVVVPAHYNRNAIPPDFPYRPFY